MFYSGGYFEPFGLELEVEVERHTLADRLSVDAWSKEEERVSGREKVPSYF